MCSVGEKINFIVRGCNEKLESVFFFVRAPQRSILLWRCYIWTFRCFEAFLYIGWWGTILLCFDSNVNSKACNFVCKGLWNAGWACSRGWKNVDTLLWYTLPTHQTQQQKLYIPLLCHFLNHLFSAVVKRARKVRVGWLGQRCVVKTWIQCWRRSLINLHEKCSVVHEAKKSLTSQVRQLPDLPLCGAHRVSARETSTGWLLV